MSAGLVAREITKTFAGVVANDAVDLEVGVGEIVGLIGPNGAGKTTFFNVITGFLPPTSGHVEFAGRDITRLPPAQRAALGMIRTFQQVNLFANLSVRENLLLGRHLFYGASPWQAALRTARARRAEAEAEAHVRELAGEVGLLSMLEAPAGTLPYGTQRLVEVTRALAAEPSLLLLDEPGAGMDSQESAHFAALLRQIQRARGLSVLVIEHDMAMVMAICHRIYVLDFGRLIASGAPDAIRADERVRHAYLGSEAHAPVG